MSPHPLPIPRRARRLRLHAAMALLAALSLLGATACSGDADRSDTDSATGSEESSGQTEGWSFTDDRGITHELDAPPERIAAQSTVAGGLDELGIHVDGVFGPLRRPDGTPDPAIGLADPDSFTSLGEVDSQINIEALAALRPQIIITPMWSDTQFWGIDENQLDQLEQIAPIVGIRVDERSITEPLARFYELAETLGADTTSGKAADAKAEFEAASTRLSDALAAKPGLTVVAASGTPAEMYVAWPGGFPDLLYYQSLGMQLVAPEEHPTSGGFWETLSWEDANKYPADLVLADARGGSVDTLMDLMPANAKALPSIAAGQITSWEVSLAYGYANLARVMDNLTKAVDDASPDIVA